MRSAIPRAAPQASAHVLPSRAPPAALVDAARVLPRAPPQTSRTSDVLYRQLKELSTDGELDSEEFYDVPTDDDDDDTLRESLRNGHVAELKDDEVTEKDKPDTPVSTLKNVT
ncbi:hypothetical protein HW555_005765 [Spodoptera exigua]|uniref:Uncharacterized protein n=1 Tax=Spodoptera exigua TaxID=7107 RepID=A0A835GFW8_SPOEX|nr:hypothetical protein HW555_005765 [Spodoptera exigua]